MARAIVEYTNSNIGIGVTGKLNKPDPNNPYGDDNTVYVCVLDNGIYYPKTIKLMHDNRIDNKNQIMEEIEVLLRSILTK